MGLDILLSYICPPSAILKDKLKSISACCSAIDATVVVNGTDFFDAIDDQG
ncbi:hypothetical protein BN844_2627 [Pseudomonas sp. SHC52]|nr:hypothetical protein BN844_2627 [Pseudomonas sp. SHC52]